MKLSYKLIVIGLLVLLALIVISVTVWVSHKPTNNNKKSASLTTQSKKSTYQAAISNSVLSTKNSSKFGQYLVDSTGHTLYVYARDVNNQSKCTGSCLQAWPAYTDSSPASGLPVNVGVIKRQDNGLSQYIYKNRPLYVYASDSAGSVTGDGVNGFTLAKP